MSELEKPQLPDPAIRRKRTLAFTVVMLGVLGAFIGLSSMEGPPAMKNDAIHKDLKDWQCLSCHTWPNAAVPGPNPLTKDHPPPRPKKPSAIAKEGPAEQFECIKCHAPH